MVSACGGVGMGVAVSAGGPEEHETREEVEEMCDEDA